MMKNKMKKIVGILISTVMVFSLFLAAPQVVQAEEIPDPDVFAGATVIGNGEWMDTGSHKLYNVYFNDEPYFKTATDKSPARGPANIMLNQAYKTRMDNTLGDYGTVYDPGTFAYYYFTLTNPANVTIYGQCSTASNSSLAIQKMNSTDDTFAPTTIALGMVTGTDEVKSMSACLSAGSYLISLGWGQGRPAAAGACYSYVKVNADYNINQASDPVWNETFPNNYNVETHEYTCTPYQIGKVMNGVTGIGTNESTNRYYGGYYSFTISEKAQFHLSDLNNVNVARVITKDGGEFNITNTDYAAILEPGDYVLGVSAKSGSKTYSFNSYTSVIPAIAGVDTMAEKGWSVSGATVTIDNLNVNSGDYAEFCIWSGDKDNAGYGKGNAKLVIKGNCFIKTLVVDCPVEVTCESGAKLVVGELVINTSDGADGKLTYLEETTYNSATKTFEGPCAHTLKTTITKATPIADGKKENKCMACGKITKTETIYAAKTVKLSVTKYTYDGKAKKPTVTIKDSQGNAIASTNYTVTYPAGRKNVGKYTVKVAFTGNYSGSKNLTFTINPPKTSIRKLTAGSKAFTVKWAKKTTQVTGYEIQYSTSKKFASGNKTVKVTSAKKVSKTIKSLKVKKTYYVRIRTYKTVNKVKYYSDWSAKKSVTTKKK